LLLTKRGRDCVEGVEKGQLDSIRPGQGRKPLSSFSTLRRAMIQGF
jgi:hypothetical protein